MSEWYTQKCLCVGVEGGCFRPGLCDFEVKIEGRSLRPRPKAYRVFETAGLETNATFYVILYCTLLFTQISDINNK